MAIGVLLLTAVMLSACIESSTTSTIGSDLKGTTTMRVGISKAAIPLLTSIGSSLGGTPTPTSGANPQDPFGDLTSQVTAMGGTAKPYDNANFMGVEITMKFSSLDEMQSQINSVLGNSSGSSSSASPLGGSGSGALVQITAKDTGSSIRIDGTVDPLSDLNDPTATAGAPPGLDFSALLGGGGKVELSFTMPGSISTADALATQSGNTVSWSFKVGDKKATIFAESAKG